MEENKSNWIKAYIVDIMPCIGVALYILAFIYNISFYSVFDINIINYISIQDTFISIIEFLIVFSVLALILVAGLSLNMALKPNDKPTPSICKISKYEIYLLRRIILMEKFTIVRRVNVYFKKQRRISWKNRNNKPSKLKLTMLAFLESYITIMFSAKIFTEIQSSYNNYTIYMPVVGMLIPFIVAPCVILFLRNATSMKKSKIKDIFNRTFASETLVMLIVYYFYSIVLFYSCGEAKGESFKSNHVQFEIKASDGSIFNNKDCLYIGRLNDNVFLMDKNTKEKVILNNEGITFMKIKYNDETIKPLIVNLMNMTKKSQANEY